MQVKERRPAGARQAEEVREEVVDLQGEYAFSQVPVKRGDPAIVQVAEKIEGVHGGIF